MASILPKAVVATGDEDGGDWVEAGEPQPGKKITAAKIKIDMIENAVDLLNISNFLQIVLWQLDLVVNQIIIIPFSGDVVKT